MKRVIAALLLATPLIASAAGEPRVKLETTQGDIVLELYPEKAPKTVQNFLTYVKEGFYDGTVFHRVIDDFMIQGGGFTPDMKQKETHAPIPNEACDPCCNEPSVKASQCFAEKGLRNTVGTIAMARTSDPDSATAQFFINVKNNVNLDFHEKTPQGIGYAVFGKVVSGMDAVGKIKAVKTTSVGMFRDVPAEPVIIKKATLLATGNSK